MNDDMNLSGLDGIDCERVLELTPVFVDEELSDSLASAVRKHLMDCVSCRAAVQEESGLRQWFRPLAAEAGQADVAIPEGFAARVTQLAFGNQLGSPSEEAPHVARGGGGRVPGHGAKSSRVSGGPRLLRSVPRDSQGDVDQGFAPGGPSLGFIMGLTATAAALMVSFTLLLAQGDRVEMNGPLHADESLEDNLEALRAENQELEREAAAAARGASDDAGRGMGQPGTDPSKIDTDEGAAADHGVEPK